jgi:zinc protease
MAQQRITDLMRYTSSYIAGKPRLTSVLLSPQARKSIGLTEAELLTPAKRPVVRP